MSIEDLEEERRYREAGASEAKARVFETPVRSLHVPKAVVVKPDETILATVQKMVASGQGCALVAGADVVMSTSALLEQGPQFLSRLTSDVSGWMYRKGYTSVSQLRGSMSQQSIPDSGAFVRGNYIRVLESYKRA